MIDIASFSYDCLAVTCYAVIAAHTFTSQALVKFNYLFESFKLSVNECLL